MGKENMVHLYKRVLLSFKKINVILRFACKWVELEIKQSEYEHGMETCFLNSGSQIKICLWIYFIENNFQNIFHNQNMRMK